MTSARPPGRRKLAAIVHSLSDARDLLCAAEHAGADAVIISPPGAAAYLGAGYFWALAEAARAEFAAVACEVVMDCGDDPGFALAALRTGFKRIVLGGDRRARAAVAQIARGLGARVCARPPLRAVAMPARRV
jgi:hypothetical protein